MPFVCVHPTCVTVTTLIICGEKLQISNLSPCQCGEKHFFFPRHLKKQQHCNVVIAIPRNRAIFAEGYHTIRIVYRPMPRLDTTGSKKTFFVMGLWSTL